MSAVLPQPLRLHVVIATVGRAAILRETVDWLGRQTRQPDGVLIATVSAADAGDVAASPMRPQILFCEKGSCVQRNHALRHLDGAADIVLFLDDDFMPADDYLAELEAIFLSEPDVVGTTGRLIADGINHEGYSVAEAAALVLGHRHGERPQKWPAEALYGCNMAVRVAALGDIEFDENLPLYGWLEDIDFSFRLGRRGALIRSERLAGVHLGVKRGRTSGLRFGYSQIANPVHLLRKRSAPSRLAFKMMARNILANMARSLWPEPYVDRRGRLRGNLLAIGHLVTARLDPRHILELS